MNEKIQLILNTLNNIEVKGKENLDQLLGCILLLETLLTSGEMTEKEGE